MTTRVLVVDANAAFATMIKQALEDLGEYRVTLAGAAAQAIGLAAQEPFDLAIVDMGLPDVSGEDAVRGLRATLPGLPVIAIPYGLDSGGAALLELDLQGTLNKPFFLPDLPGIVEQALERPVAGMAPPPRARTRPAGVASPAPPAAEPAAASPMPEAAWLKDPAIASSLLAGAAPAAGAEAVVVMSAAGPVAQVGAISRENTAELLQAGSPGWPPHGARAGALMKYVKLPATGAVYMLYAARLAADLWLALVYKPDAPIGRVRQQARAAADALLTAPPVGQVQQEQPAPLPAEAPTRVGHSKPAPVTAPLPPETLFDFAPEAAPQSQPADVLEDTLPNAPVALPPQVVVDNGLLLPAQERLPELVHASNALYSLTYTLAWAPKYPRTRLTGNIAGMLDEWIRHLALAYDWRAERVEVRPECVAVNLSCSPATAPEQMVNVLKRATSDRVLAEFPTLAADHPGGDFWAPGYLLLGGSQSLTPQQVADFLAHTRRGQGLANLPNVKRAENTLPH
jgi:CheY-like chemotaxis protein